MTPGLHTAILLLFIPLFTGTLCHRSERDDDRGFVRVTSIIQPPFLMMAQETNETGPLRGNDKYTGYIPDLLMQVGDRASITYRIYLVKDGKYGSMDRDREWSGMVGELLNREADIAAAPLTRTREREAVIDFSYSFMNAPLTMLVHKDAPYEKVDDLVNASYPESAYGVVDGGSTMNSFSSSTQPPYSLVWANMASKNGMLVDTLEEGVERVREGNYVLIGERPDLEYKAKKLHCDVRTTDTFYLGGEPSSYALAMPTGHPYLADINKVLLKLQEENELTRLYRKWWNPRECPSGAQRSHSSGTALVLCLLVTIGLLRKLL